MGETNYYGLPWPEDNDPADIPVDMQQLAEAVEGAIVGGFADMSWKPGSGTGSMPPGTTPVAVSLNPEKSLVIPQPGFLSIQWGFWVSRGSKAAATGGYTIRIVPANTANVIDTSLPGWDQAFVNQVPDANHPSYEDIPTMQQLAIFGAWWIPTARTMKLICQACSEYGSVLNQQMGGFSVLQRPVVVQFTPGHPA